MGRIRCRFVLAVIVGIIVTMIPYLYYTTNLTILENLDLRNRPIRLNQSNSNEFRIHQPEKVPLTEEVTTKQAETPVPSIVPDVQVTQESVSGSVKTQMPITERPEEIEEVIVIRNGTRGLEWVPEGKKEFANCPELKSHQMCSYEPSENEEELSKADAVLYRAFHVLEESYMPKKRNVNQKWIFFETEPPFRTWNKHRWNNVTIWDKMNISITYAPDADIVFGMYAVKCSATDKPSLPAVDYAASKKTKALWVVSNCLSSGRMAYVKELQKYFPVKIYGDCGAGRMCGHFATDLKCEKAFLEQYKFYIAFENSYCKHYYTEKVVKTMSVETVPVVLGLSNYTQIIGDGTHVNAKDFKSPKELGAYLHKLANDSAAYNKIILNKKKMSCKKEFNSNHMMCQLCKRLHDKRLEKEMLPDMRQVWGVKENCVNPKNFLRQITGDSLGNIEVSKIYKMHGME